MKYKMILFLFIFASIFLYGETSLWKVEANGNYFYLGGTIHILSKSDYPLPEEYDSAFRDSDILVLEADVGAMVTPEFQQAMTAAFMLPAGLTLRDQLSEPVFEMLASYLAELQLPIVAFSGFKPSFLALTLTLLEYQRLGIDDSGVDQHYYSLAQSAGKDLTFFETAEQQFNYLANMGEGHEDELISSTLNDIHTLKESMSDMTASWRNGDVKRLEKYYIREMQEETPELYKALLVERNNLWMPEIASMAATPEVELILVGAAHLVGLDGLLAKCEELGFLVEKF